MYDIDIQHCKLYTISDLQAILKISRSFAYALIHNREIRCVHIHRLLRISPWALAEYMNTLSPDAAQAQRATIGESLCNPVTYFTIAETQQILQISNSFARRLLHSGELCSKRIHQETRISSVALYQFIVSHED